VDGLRLREQFTFDCVERLFDALRKGKQRPKVTLGHHGRVLAKGLLDLTFRKIHFLGLEFSARLPDTSENRQLIELAKDGLAVSVGYRSLRQWHVDRDGVGKVRVIDEAELDHIAVLDPAEGMNPLYAAARCFGAKGSWMMGPSDLRQRAEQVAYRLVKQQAGLSA
jgi:phage head maturation protease